MSDSGPMDQLDQLNIETPEQVDLRLPIAGIGSRFLAVLADTILQIATELLLILLFAPRGLSTLRDARVGRWLGLGAKIQDVSP